MKLKLAVKSNLHSLWHRFDFSTAPREIGSVCVHRNLVGTRYKVSRRKWSSAVQLVSYFVICFAKMRTEIELLSQSSVVVKQQSRGGKHFKSFRSIFTSLMPI